MKKIHNSGNDKDIVKIKHPRTFRPDKKRGKLPSNFFERLLTLEMDLRNHFSINTLDELVAMYTMAIEFYESKSDIRARDYQMRMANILSNQDILRNISDANKPRMSTINNSSIGNSSENFFILDDKKKNQLKLKVNYMKNNIPDLKITIGGILKKEEEKNPGDVRSIIKNEFNKQKQQWKHKLINKKKIIKAKSQITSPDVLFNHKLDAFTPQIANNTNINDIQIPEIPIPEKKANENEYESIVELNKTLEAKLSVLDNLITTINVNDENSPERIKEQQEFDIAILPNKFQDSFVSIDDKINGYINNFNEYFYKDIFEAFFNQLKKVIDEKYDKYITICQIYHSQIKEKEFLINEENVDITEKENLMQIIEGLKEEQEHEIGRINDQYNTLINAKVTEFKMNSLKMNSGLQVIEEQFKLDVYQLMSDVI